MIATGIVMRIDELRRIVIPASVSKWAFGTEEIGGKAMEFFYEKDGTIILKPYEVK